MFVFFFYIKKAARILGSCCEPFDFILK